MRQQHELAGSSMTQILHYVTRRRHRSFVFTGVAIVFLVLTVWTYGNFVIRSSESRLHDDFANKNSTSDHQTQKTAGQESCRSQWSTQNPIHLIPPKIWQISLPKEESIDELVTDSESLRDTPSWLTMNTDYT